MKANRVLIAALSLACTSCVTSRRAGLEPVSPKTRFTMPAHVQRVSSTTPALEWTAAPQGGARYDVIIYLGHSQGTWSAQPYAYFPGKEVYYRENLPTTRHTVETPLALDTVHLWSVRTRTGTNVSGWSNYSFRNDIGGQRGDNLWWSFRTPTM